MHTRMQQSVEACFSLESWCQDAYLGANVALGLLGVVFPGEEGHHLGLGQGEAVLHALLPLPALPVGLAFHEARAGGGCIAVPPANGVLKLIQHRSEKMWWHQLFAHQSAARC